jgi:CBS domain-containing protein
MALGLFQVFTGAVVGGFWLILIGLFLKSAAGGSYARVAMQETLARVPVRDVMTPDVITVPASTTVDDLVERFWAHHVTSFPVVDGGAVRGIASIHQLQAIPRERWSTTRVAEVMRRLDPDLVIRPDDSVFAALERASRNNLGRLAVLDGPRLVGYLSLKDITHVLVLGGAGRVPLPAHDETTRTWRRVA